jgi:cation diffusion facilitator family transporter
MYSAKDVVNSLLVIVGMSISDKDLDREHPYGHGKIEFILAMFVSIIFIGITVYLLIHAVSTLIEDDIHRAPHLIALWAALLAIAVNVVMYFYSRCVAIERNSPLVRTLAKHHHADAAASLAVACGIVGAHYLNMPWIDTAVALLETAHLVYLGGDVFWDSAKGLMDRSVENPIRDRIKTLIESVEGVDEVKHIQTRNVGQDMCIETNIGIDSELSVAEAAAIREEVKEAITHAIPRVGFIQVSTEAHSADAVEREQVRSKWGQAKLNGPRGFVPEAGE